MSEPQTTTSEPAPLYQPSRSTKHKGVTTTDIALMVQLAEEGKTQAEIAQRLGLSQPTVHYHLSQFAKPTRELAERLMDASLLNDAQRLNDIAEKGAADEAIKAIKLKWQARKMVDDAKSNSNIGIQVVIGMPGQPAGPDPFEAKGLVEAKAVVVRED